MYKNVLKFIKELYPNETKIPLHAPVFKGNEKKLVTDCIDSTFVSSVGQYVNKFEEMLCHYTKAKYAVATTNGTSALHMALILVGVEEDTEVITQALTFVATANAISYLKAEPIFIDSGKENLGISHESLEEFLNKNVEIINGKAINKLTKKRISACVPMHVFGHPAEMNKIKTICDHFNIPIVEDSAESLGSFYNGEHTGLKGLIGVLSFNGNKIVTCGGGGAIITNDEKLAKRAKHLTTTAKLPHAWEFYHDEIGYNYRLPNINAALACAQMEQLDKFVKNKRETAKMYKDFFEKESITFVNEPKGCESNFWLNAIQLKDKETRDLFLKETNENGIMTRPIWQLMVDLPPFKKCQKTNLVNAKNYVATIVNLPSGVRGNF